MNLEDVVLVFILVGELHLCAWFEIVENYTIHVLLRTSFIEQFIRGILPRERKVVLGHVEPVAIISLKTATNSMNADNSVMDVNKHSQDEDSSDELNLFCVARQVTIPEHIGGTELVSSQGSECMKIKTYSNDVERRCSMAVRGLMDFIPGKPFHIYILSMTSKVVSLQKFMIVAYVSIAPTCIIHVR